MRVGSFLAEREDRTPEEDIAETHEKLLDHGRSADLYDVENDVLVEMKSAAEKMISIGDVRNI